MLAAVKNLRPEKHLNLRTERKKLSVLAAGSSFMILKQVNFEELFLKKFSF